MTIVRIKQYKACNRMWTEQWHNQDKTYSIQCSMSNDSAICGIMHEETADVDCGDLPNVWISGKKKAVTCTLPCSHTFHPSTLALHFLTRGMFCPICRRGDDSRMSVESVPSSVKPVFQKKSSHLIEQTLNDDASDALTENFSQDHVNSMLVLQADICATRIGEGDSNITVISTPLLCESNTSENGTVCFQVHRSFKRILFTTLEKLHTDNTHHIFVNFSLCHPVLSEVIESGGCTLPFTTEFSMRCRELAGNQILSTLHVDTTNREVFLKVDIEAIHSLCMHCMFTALRQGVHAAIHWVEEVN